VKSTKPYQEEFKKRAVEMLRNSGKRAVQIARELGMGITQRIGNTVGRARLSYEKPYDLLAERLIKARDLSELDRFDPDPKHVEPEKRTRKSPVESGILALT
jgi:transposase-like protein